MKLNIWLGICGLLFLIGCGVGVSYIPYDLKEPPRVAKNPSDVLLIFDATKITKPYKEIGVIQTESDWSFSEQIEYLRKEAAKRGADAVINIQETSSNKTGWTNYETSGFYVPGTFGYSIGNTWFPGTPGYYMPGSSLIIPNNTTIIKIRGTAIIFLEEK